MLSLHGIIPPLLTPLSSRDSLDVAGLERLIEHVLAGGVHGLFILGTTGEAPSLSSSVRRDMIRLTCRIVRGRVPVLVGVTDSSITESLQLARFSADCGADAVVVAPPFYFPLDEPALTQYYRQLLAELVLPLILYNMPTVTKIHIPLATVQAAMENPRAVGVKDSSGNITYFQKLLHLAQARKDWTVMIGPEELLFESLILGGQGGVTGGANLQPTLFVRLYEAATAGRYSQAIELHRAVIDLGRTMYDMGAPFAGPIHALKYALKYMRVCNDYVNPPLYPLNETQQRKLLLCLEKLQLSASSSGSSPPAPPAARRSIHTSH